MNVTYPHEIVGDGCLGLAVCHAPAGAFCRRGCAAGECDSWNYSGCAHGPLVDHGSCYVVECLTAVGIDDTRGEDVGTGLDDFGHETYRGPIDVEWHGEGYEWFPVVTS